MVYGYVATLRSCLILWLTTFCVPLAGEFGRWSIPVVSGLAYLFLIVEQTAVEIEQPFGDDANDLPMERYIVDLQTTLLEMRPGYNAFPTAPANADAQDRSDGVATEEVLARRLAALEAQWQKSSPSQGRSYQL